MGSAVGAEDDIGAFVCVEVDYVLLMYLLQQFREPIEEIFGQVCGFIKRLSLNIFIDEACFFVLRDKSGYLREAAKSSEDIEFVAGDCPAEPVHRHTEEVVSAVNLEYHLVGMVGL